MAAPTTKRTTAKKQGRMNFRLDPKIKERVARAAAITGQGLTDFAVSTLSEKADEIISRHDTLLLDRDEFNFFLGLLEEARAPSKRSLAAAKRYRRGRREGVRHRF
jgi:uncharacterized protein (DUF1778 family)